MKRAYLLTLFAALLFCSSCTTVKNLMHRDAEAKGAVTIQKQTLYPEKVSPGDTVLAEVHYHLTPPKGTKALKITETRTLVGGDESMDLSTKTFMRLAGDHSSVLEFTLPSDIEPGDYTLTTKVSCDQGEATIGSKLGVMGQ